MCWLAEMATYYIDPSVVGPGTGTELDPFSSWSSVTWAAGNAYLQKRGTTSTERIAIGASGTAGSRIYVGAYGDPLAAKPKVRAASGNQSVAAFGRGYWQLVDFDISHTPAGTGLGLESYHSADTGRGILLRRVDFSECYGNGFSIYTIAPGAPKIIGLLVEDCTFTNNGGHGSIVYGAVQSAVFRRCTYTGNGVNVATHGASSFAARASALGNAFTLTSGTTYSKAFASSDFGFSSGTVSAILRVIKNTASVRELTSDGATTTPASGKFGWTGGTLYVNFGEAIGVSDTIWAFAEEAKNIIYEDCEFSYQNRPASVEGAGIQFDDGSVGVVRRCYSHHNEGPGVVINLGAGAVIETSKIENNAAGGVYTAVAPGSVVRNCAIASNGTNGIEAAFGSDNCVIQNNYIAGHTTAIVAPTTATVTTNACWNNTNVSSGGVTPSGTVTSDPKLNADYTLQSDSPLIHAGTHAEYGRDWRRLQRPNPPSIGIYDVPVLEDWARQSRLLIEAGDDLLLEDGSFFLKG